MNSAKSFVEFYQTSFKSEVSEDIAQKLSDDFFADFIYYTPIKLDLLESYLKAGQIDYFYKSLADFKYLVEYSDDFNRYWYILRAYSGALSKLKDNLTVKGSKKIYTAAELEYFILKYQRILLENLTIYKSFVKAFIIDLKKDHAYEQNLSGT